MHLSYYVQCEAVARKHSEAADAVKRFVTTMPTREQMRTFLSSAAYVTTSLLMPYGYGKVIGTLASSALNPLFASCAKAATSTRFARSIIKQAQRAKSGTKLVEAHCQAYLSKYFPSRRQAITFYTDRQASIGGARAVNSLTAAAVESSIPLGGIKKRKLNKNHNVLKAAEELAARNGAPVDILPKLSDSDFERAVAHNLEVERMKHFFPPCGKHKFENLTQILGSKENIVRAVLKEVEGKLPSMGKIAEGTTVTLHGNIIVVRGYIIEGIPRLGTIFPISINGVPTKMNV